MADLKVPSQSVAGVHEQFHRAPVNLYTFVFGSVVKTMSPSAVQLGYIRKYMDVSKKKKVGMPELLLGTERWATVYQIHEIWTKSIYRENTVPYTI